MVLVFWNVSEKKRCHYSLLLTDSGGRSSDRMVSVPNFGSSAPGSSPGARFSKLPVITGPVKLFCFPFQMGVSKVLTIVQESYQLNKQNELY